MGKAIKKEPSPQVLLIVERAKGRGIKLPRSKAILDEISTKVEENEEAEDILASLEDQHGLTTEGQKRKDAKTFDELEGDALAVCERAFARGIKIPKKDVGAEAVQEAIEEADNDQEKALTALEEKFGLSAAAVKLEAKRKSVEGAKEEQEERKKQAKALFAERAAARAAAGGDGAASSDDVEPPIEDPGEWIWPPEEDQEGRRDMVKELVKLCKEAQITVPGKNAAEKCANAQASLSASLEGETVPVMKLLKAMAIQNGAKWLEKPFDVVTEENRGLAVSFKELSRYAFKEGDTMRGVAYKKVADWLQTYEQPVTEKPKAGKFPGVGKSSCDKIAEFLDTGKVAKLEQYRAQYGDI